jgi:Putative prokaryotic signal transducing protein
MTAPAVARVATTPNEAKILVALLQAEGIPAHVDGEALADEVALSQRAMNLQGVRVIVPTSSLEQAREILADTAVSEAELEAQALAAGEATNETPATNKRTARLVAFLLFAVVAIVWILSTGAVVPTGNG